jgi:ERCC4-related helicase
MFTTYHSKYYATQLTLKRPSNTIESLASSLSGAKVDLNPHQIDAALFAFRSPLSNGVLLADEVGLGKTIEAGIVISQIWAERKRNILLIVPASLRNQWLSELDEKFYIKSMILESKNYNRIKKEGKINPFKQKDNIVICSYNFVASKAQDVSNVNWDLVIIDEAHRLRNVYKKSNVTGFKLKTSLVGKKKLLLTATPLQNSLMELYGLVSIIDEHVFGDVKTFRDMYINVDNEDIRNIFLKNRLQQFCKRTLRKQVVEYVPYTKRIPILQEYSPTKEEEELYNKVAEYLKSSHLYALPNSQRKLMTTILWKLLASSSFAISGTLESLINRLKSMLDGIDSELEITDFDAIEEMMEEWSEEENEERQDLIKDRKGIDEELQKLIEHLELAKSININAKGENLLQALEKGFAKASELGSKRKAVIFTESRRTQQYLFNLLVDNGYKGSIVFLNGSNNDEGSKEIYKTWLEKHKGQDIVSGSKQADMKAAIIEEFRERASILIGTEAAAEGINLQFCSLLVNYDMPWNPQRIEQRIGRCHRYGQKNDVVVVNFLNIKNDADKRVYELLDQKFKLFEGVFGSSDEVLGSIETGIDFEKRITEIYQTCRNADDIKQAFDNIQVELEEQIKAKMMNTRETLLENFDEEVSKRLKICTDTTNIIMSKYEQWLFDMLKSEEENNIEILDDTRFYYRGNKYKGYYNLNWKQSEKLGDCFFRKEHPISQELINKALSSELPVSEIHFDYTHSLHKISFFETLNAKSGWLAIDKLINTAFEIQEHLLFTAISDDGSVFDDELTQKLMELPALKILQLRNSHIPEEIEIGRDKNKQEKMQQIKQADFEYYKEECDKLDSWADDLKDGLEREIKQMEREISELKKSRSGASNLEEAVEIKKQITALEKKKHENIKNLYAEYEKIDLRNEDLQKNIENQLNGKNKIEQVFLIKWKIV